MAKIDMTKEMVREKERDKVHYITPIKLVFIDDVRFGAKIETCHLSESGGELVMDANYENEKDAIDAAKHNVVEGVMFVIAEGSGGEICISNLSEDIVAEELDIRIQKTEIVDKSTLCPECEGETQKVGTRAYADGVYQMRRCKDCGHNYRAEKIGENRGMGDAPGFNTTASIDVSKVCTGCLKIVPLVAEKCVACGGSDFEETDNRHYQCPVCGRVWGSNGSNCSPDVSPPVLYCNHCEGRPALKFIQVSQTA